VVLRDGARVDGGVYLTDGQSLAPYLGTRKGGWVNIVSAIWRGEGETHYHAVLQADHMLLAYPAEAGVPVYFATKGAVPRSVDVSLEDGTRLTGELHLAEKQRMSDYLFSCGRFMPVLNAVLMPSEESLGDVALNSTCVKAVRDAKVFTAEAPSAEAAAAAWGGIRRSTGSMPAIAEPVNRDTIRTDAGSFEVITPGRIPDRRAGKPYVSPVPPPQPRVAPIDESELTPAERARSETLSRHWLVQVCAGAQLLPPDPRRISDAPTLEEIWHGIADRNDMADVELAIHVASSFKLQFANLDEVTPEAVRIVPEKLARKLGILPVKVAGKSLTVALSDPGSLEIEQQLGFVTRLTLEFVVAAPIDIRAALEKHYPAR
jgi:hypothetical protein